MKRMISMFLILVMVFALLLPATDLTVAYADDLINEVKGDYGSGSSASGGPSEADILYVCSRNEIQLPNSNSYLDDYLTMFVDAPKKLCAYVYKKPSDESKKLEYAYQGSKVVVLAMESGYSCILYTTADNERKAGWIHQSCISSVYPGVSYYCGEDSWLSGCVNCGDACTRWSNESFVGTKIKYTIIDSLPAYLSECKGMTIEYKITGRGTNDDLNREVYINYGDGWESYGKFTIDDNLSPVRINFSFKQPVSVKGVAVIPTNPYNNDFSFRQTVVDVLSDSVDMSDSYVWDYSDNTSVPAQQSTIYSTTFGKNERTVCKNFKSTQTAYNIFDYEVSNCTGCYFSYKAQRSGSSATSCTGRRNVYVRSYQGERNKDDNAWIYVGSFDYNTEGKTVTVDLEWMPTDVYAMAVIRENLSSQCSFTASWGNEVILYSCG